MESLIPSLPEWPILVTAARAFLDEVAAWAGEAAGWAAPHLAALRAALPDTVWAALISAVVTLFLAVRLMPRAAAAPEAGLAGGRDEAACRFLINGSSVKPLTPGARSLLEGIAGRATSLEALAHHLERDCPMIREELEQLVLFGRGFRRLCQRGDGTSYEVVGGPEGGAALLSIRPASAEVQALDAAERALARARAELDLRGEVLDRAPLLAWTRAPDGQVSWANARYLAQVRQPEAGAGEGRLPDILAHVLEDVPLTARAEFEHRRRVSLAGCTDAEAHWFEVCQTTLAGGETVSYAVEADDLVAAEASLRRFVETLTETFAHLPIGLAVFDKNRRLGLFNPALSDLTKVDAAWLASRPSLRDFLERLRETRQLPEQKDFAAFRRMLTELEEGAREGTYEENWVLPSGAIFRVTGRPHPQGALAFLFEDISTTIQLERRYRAELELSQATLDRMAEAVAVFDTSGMLVFVNAAFERLWGIDPMKGLEGPGVAELTALWQERCHDSPLWAELRAFATGAEARTSWEGSVRTRAGDVLSVLVAPLPTGSTLVTFRRREPAPAASPEVVALPAPAARAEPSAPKARAGSEDAPAAPSAAAPAPAGLEATAEAAPDSLPQALAAGPAPRRLQAGYDHAFRELEAALGQDRAAGEAAAAAGGGPVAGAGVAPAVRLAELLAGRGLALGSVRGAGGGQRDWAAEGEGRGALPALAPGIEAALPGLVAAIASLGVPGARVDADLGEDGIALSVPVAPERGTAADAAARPAEPAALLIARRRLEAAGLALDVARAEGRVTLRVRALAAAGPHRASAGV